MRTTLLPGPELRSAARLAYILKMYPRFSETFILNEILELERQGVDLSIYSLKLPNDGHFHADVARVKAPVAYLPEVLFRTLPRYARAHREVFGWNRGVYLRILGRVLKRRRFGAIKRFLQAGYIAPRLRAEGISHVHAHFASSATSVALYVHQLAGISYSFTAHAKDIYIDSVADEVLRRKLNGARFVVTVSNYNRTHLVRLAGTTPIVRIYNGLDLEQFAPNGIHPADPALILGVGRLVEKKGFADLIHACAALRDGGVPFHCLIVGQGEMELELKRIVAGLGLEDTVEFPGPMAREELLCLYPRASVVAAPCIIGSDGNRDGLPTVLIEAMALGVPVISTGVTGIPELVRDGETGVLAPQRDPIGLARTIEAVLGDRAQAMTMAQTGRRHVEERFDLRTNVAELRTLFERASREGTEV